MGRHLFVALTNAAPGQSEEFNVWYDDHIRQVLALNGFERAERFELSAVQPAQDGEYQYLTIYEVEGPNLKAAHRALLEALGSGRIGLSEVVGTPGCAYWFTSMDHWVEGQSLSP
jgi:hypothetical protein